MFQTRIDIPESNLQIAYQDRILAFGSCFAENMGQKLLNAAFHIKVNPFGVLYNPVSIQNSIEYLLNAKQFSEDDLFLHRGLWNSFAHSTLFSDIDPDSTLTRIRNSVNEAQEVLQNPKYFIITWGTAWIFEDTLSGQIVSNCHKLPASRFNRRRLSVQEITELYIPLLNTLHNRFPQIRVLFSVSPVRHIKDGLHENNVSKSTLLLAIEALTSVFNFCEYFPAYEIQMDELRDYRFYADDMLHPSPLAVNYIWQRFIETYLDTNTREVVREVEQLRADENHRPLFPQSDEYKKFRIATNTKKAQLLDKYPFLAGRL